VTAIVSTQWIEYVFSLIPSSPSRFFPPLSKMYLVIQLAPARCSLTNSDGSPQSLVSSTIIGILLFSATLYISLDTSQQWTDTFTLGDDLVAKTLFVLTLIWPALYVYLLFPFPLPCHSEYQTSKTNNQGALLISSAWLAFVITMISVSIIKLNETKPARTFISLFSPIGVHNPSLTLVPDSKLIIVMQLLAALLFAGSQVVFFLASEPLCNVSPLPLFTPPLRLSDVVHLLREDGLMNRLRKGRSIVPSYVLYYRPPVW
jgi:hypothetical protein